MIKIDRSGFPFIVGVWVPAAALLAVQQPVWAFPLVVLGGLFAFFFRDPDRHPPADPGAVVAPADGLVLHAGDVEPDAAPPGEWHQVSIFLSPLDVHVNRVPASGRVTRVAYRPGRFLPAFGKKAGTENERTEVWIDHAGQTVICRQIVGILARRVVCRLAAGAEVETGQRFGIMKFGSRMDVFTPQSAALRVTAGEAVRGGETILAVLDQAVGSQGGEEGPSGQRSALAKSIRRSFADG